MAVNVSYNTGRTRAAFRFAHPKGNSITIDIVRALRTGLESAAQNPHLKLMTIAGEGTDFSFGASISEHTADRIGAVLPEMHALLEDLLDAPSVTAAIVRGRCLGGGFELALACDFIFAAEDAAFGLPEIALGVFPPAGSLLLPARVGSARAGRTILTGETQSARQWHDAGLIELIAPAGALDDQVDAWFDRHLAPKSAAALRHAAAAARASLRHQMRTLLPAIEQLYLEDLMRTHDAVEGIDAFLQKRAPQWNDS
jgi:cyclohexa-1,5-dienecarbonyl-CoA hydratase